MASTYVGESCWRRGEAPQAYIFFLVLISLYLISRLKKRDMPFFNVIDATPKIDIFYKPASISPRLYCNENKGYSVVAHFNNSSDSTASASGKPPSMF